MGEKRMSYRESVQYAQNKALKEASKGSGSSAKVRGTFEQTSNGLRRIPPERQKQRDVA